MSTSPPKRVLVVDDETSIVKYLEALLQDHGYETDSAQNGNEALEKARETPPDLISLDITMPEKSGIRFYRELKEEPELKHIPVVVVTAYTVYEGDADPLARFSDEGQSVPPPEELIHKPIDRDAFLEVVARLLGTA